MENLNVVMSPKLSKLCKQYIGCPRGSLGIIAPLPIESTFDYVLRILRDYKEYTIEGVEDTFICIPKLQVDYLLSLSEHSK